MTSRYMPFKNLIMALMLSPMIVPLIIMAAGMFFFYTLTTSSAPTSVSGVHAPLDLRLRLGAWAVLAGATHNELSRDSRMCSL
jgi:ABC-type spermidine/putrescine transport system permease subunit II